MNVVVGVAATENAVRVSEVLKQKGKSRDTVILS